MSPLLIIDAVLFLGLATHIGLRAARTGQLALRRLAWFVASIGVVAAMLPLVGEEGESWPVVVVMLGSLALYPALLLRLGAALAPNWGRLERWAVVVLGVEAVALAVTPFVLAPLDALLADMAVVAVLAVVAHAAVHVVLERQVQELSSSFVRRRARALQAGLLLLTLALVGGVIVEAHEAAAAVAAAAGLLLSAATAPPRWLQIAFAQPDYERLLDAEEAIATAPDADAATRDLLEGLRRLVTGRAAWLERDDRVLAAVGEEPGTFATVDGDGPSEGPRPVLTRDGTTLWRLEATAPSAVRLCVVAGQDPVLYGLQDADLLPRTARRVAIALQGRELEANRRAQERAEQEADHYRRVAALKDDLLATINHELRTPLQTVAGALELVTARWDAVADDQRRLLVTRADVNARALTDVVLQVLSLVEMRTGMTRPLPAPTSLSAVVAAALDELDDAGRVEVVCPDVELVVDERLTARVLHELVENALTHTAGPVRVELGVDGHELSMLVHDTGPGLSDDLLAPFERGGHYLHRTSRGLGLGLSLVVETVQVLGGELEVVNGGTGATVACRLPHAAATAADRGAAARPS